MEYRTEKDSLGEVNVPATAYYGAQTARSLHNFNIALDTDRMPLPIIRALALVKSAAALTNADLGVLSAEKAELIAKVADEIIAGTTANSHSRFGRRDRARRLT